MVLAVQGSSAKEPPKSDFLLAVLLLLSGNTSPQSGFLQNFFTPARHGSKRGNCHNDAGLSRSSVAGWSLNREEVKDHLNPNSEVARGFMLSARPVFYRSILV